MTIEMGSGHILITQVMILACIILQNNPVAVAGGNLPSNGSREYAKKPRGTLKTVKKLDGDVVDCVDIYKQPSVHHPLLKNHTVQLKPPSSPQNNPFQRNAARWSLVNAAENERCPNGTVPIRRPFKDEAVKAFLTPSRHAVDNGVHATQMPDTIHKYALYSQKHTKRDMTGVSAKINVWKPSTQQVDFSVAQIWAAYVPNNAVETIEAGWMVYPNKYGDNEPRFFVFYTNNEYKTGCYNSECKGFVVVDSPVCLGCKLTPYSTYNGDQFEIDLALLQNSQTKEWWVEYQGKMIGYWPRQLFPGLSEGGANAVEWGGEVAESAHSAHPTSTHMGSGHFPNEGSGKAAYFQELQFKDANFRSLQPDPANLETILSHPRCYDVSQVFGNGEGSRVGLHFYFGGPGADAPTCNA